MGKRRETGLWKRNYHDKKELEFEESLHEVTVCKPLIVDEKNATLGIRYTTSAFSLLSTFINSILLI